MKPLGPSPTPTADRPRRSDFPGRYPIPTLTLTELTQPALTNTTHNQPHMVQPSRPPYCSTDRPIDRLTDRPTNQPRDRDRTDRPTDRPNDKLTDRLTDPDWLADLLADRPADLPTDRPRASERASERPTYRPTDRPTDRPIVTAIATTNESSAATATPYGSTFPKEQGNARPSFSYPSQRTHSGRAVSVTRDASVTDGPRAGSCQFHVGFMLTVSGGGGSTEISSEMKLHEIS